MGERGGGGVCENLENGILPEEMGSNLTWQYRLQTSLNLRKYACR